jgi:hypothetical protein
MQCAMGPNQAAQYEKIVIALMPLRSISCLQGDCEFDPGSKFPTHLDFYRRVKKQRSEKSYRDYDEKISREVCSVVVWCRSFGDRLS